MECSSFEIPQEVRLHGDGRYYLTCHYHMQLDDDSHERDTRDARAEQPDVTRWDRGTVCMTSAGRDRKSLLYS